MHDAWFFVGVFVFIFLIWIATGGPTHPLAFSGPRLQLPGILGGGNYLSLPRAPLPIGGSTVSLLGSSNGSTVSLPGSSVGGVGTSDNRSVPSSSSLSGVAFGTPSPYRGIVSLDHYVSGAGATKPRDEYIQINVSQNTDVPVDLTGWTIKSEATGNATIIPQGSETPTSGTINAVRDIVLTAGERALAISGRSPIGGSFRENKCIGYFSQYQTFVPSLPLACPLPQDELAALYPGYIRDTACIDYVKTLSRCQVTLTPPPNVSGACQTFLVQYLNYNGCVDAHKQDGDFLGTLWHIYLGRDSSMWLASHEVVKLLDASGKTVDAFSY